MRVQGTAELHYIEVYVLAGGYCHSRSHVRLLGEVLTEGEED